MSGDEIVTDDYTGPDRRMGGHYTGPERRRGRDFVSRNRWTLLTIWIVAFSITVGWIAIENRHRIDDIQQARLSSCQRTYEGIREVFRPFFPVDENGKPLPGTTPDQLQNYVKFNTTIDEKKAQCGQQTQVTRTEP